MWISGKEYEKLKDCEDLNNSYEADVFIEDLERTF